MDILKQFFNSKKFFAALASALIIILSDGIGLTADQATKLVETIWLYMGAQGLADIGKEKAKIDLNNSHQWNPRK